MLQELHNVNFFSVYLESYNSYVAVQPRVGQRHELLYAKIFLPQVFFTIASQLTILTIFTV